MLLEEINDTFGGEWNCRARWAQRSLQRGELCVSFCTESQQHAKRIEQHRFRRFTVFRYFFEKMERISVQRSRASDYRFVRRQAVIDVAKAPESRTRSWS